VFILTKWKETEIGKIPEDWEIINLEQASELLTDGSHFSPKEDPKGDCFIATVKDMGEFEFDLVACKRISRTVFDKLAKANCKPEKGDVLFSKDGTMGLCFVYSQDVPLVLLSSIAIIRPTKEFDSYFLKYHLSNPKVLDLIISGHSSGSALPRLTLTNLKGIPILKPPLAEQRAIAKILSDLDSKIELNQQMNKTLEDIAQAIFKRWFIDFEFPNEEGKPYKSSGCEMVDSKLGKIPKGWKISKIGDELKTVIGGTPSTANKLYWENGTIAWINSGAINEFPIVNATDYITTKGLSNSATKIMPKKTVVLPLVISIEKPIPISILGIESSGNQSVVGIIANERIPCEYIFYWIKFMKKDIYSWMTGGAQQHINKENVDSTSILIPAEEVMKKYKKLVVPMFNRILENSYEIKNLKHIRDLLLPKLMTGKIRVPIKGFT